jgi:hypothetical protein
LKGERRPLLPVGLPVSVGVMLNAKELSQTAQRRNRRVAVTGVAKGTTGGSSNGRNQLKDIDYRNDELWERLHHGQKLAHAEANVCHYYRVETTADAGESRPEGVQNSKQHFLAHGLW